MSSKKAKNKVAPPSAVYQWMMVEIGMDGSQLHNYSNEQSISAHMDNNFISDEIIDCQKEIIDELMNIIKSTALTKHQRTILMYTLNGETQNSIAEKLGVSQSACHKSLYGNICYSEKDERGDPKRYGGSIKKLKRLSAKNQKIQDILQKIERIKQDND